MSDEPTELLSGIELLGVCLVIGGGLWLGYEAYVCVRANGGIVLCTGNVLGKDLANLGKDAVTWSIQTGDASQRATCTVVKGVAHFAQNRMWGKFSFLGALAPCGVDNTKNRAITTAETCAAMTAVMLVPGLNIMSAPFIAACGASLVGDLGVVAKAFEHLLHI
jgi:hypothetical protein